MICGCLVAVVHGGLISSGLIGTSGPAAVSLHPGTTVSLQPGTITFPSVSSSSSNIIRGIGNLGAISAYSKSVDTAFSSERKADVRINNPGVQTSILSAGSVPATLSYAATAPALAVSGTALAGKMAAVKIRSNFTKKTANFLTFKIEKIHFFLSSFFLINRSDALTSLQFFLFFFLTIIHFLFNCLTPR